MIGTGVFGPRGILLGLALAAVTLAAQAAESPGRTLMRFPTLYGNTIIFVAHDNLWSVARTGGAAARLTADEGRDVMPRISPDGRWIAFSGEYQGNRDVYVIPSTGGPAMAHCARRRGIASPASQPGP